MSTVSYVESRKNSVSLPEDQVHRLVGGNVTELWPAEACGPRIRKEDRKKYPLGRLKYWEEISNQNRNWQVGQLCYQTVARVPLSEDPPDEGDAGSSDYNSTIKICENPEDTDKKAEVETLVVRMQA